MWFEFCKISGLPVFHTFTIDMMCEICIDYRASHNRRTQFWNNAGR